MLLYDLFVEPADKFAGCLWKSLKIKRHNKYDLESELKDIIEILGSDYHVNTKEQYEQLITALEKDDGNDQTISSSVIAAIGFVAGTAILKCNLSLNFVDWVILYLLVVAVLIFFKCWDNNYRERKRKRVILQKLRLVLAFDMLDKKEKTLNKEADQKIEQ